MMPSRSDVCVISALVLLRILPSSFFRMLLTESCLYVRRLCSVLTVDGLHIVHAQDSHWRRFMVESNSNKLRKQDDGVLIHRCVRTLIW